MNKHFNYTKQQEQQIMKNNSPSGSGVMLGIKSEREDGKSCLCKHIIPWVLKEQMKMKRGIDIGISPIKPTTKASNKELDELLYEINDTLYFFRNLYINQRAKDYLMKEIERIGKQLKVVTITRESQQLARRNQILGDLRGIWESLRHYTVVNPIIGNEDISEEEIKMNKYLTASFLKEKKEGLSEDQYIEWLKKLKRFSKYYPVTDNVKSINKEIIKHFEL